MVCEIGAGFSEEYGGDGYHRGDYVAMVRNALISTADLLRKLAKTRQA